jgi:hypothetical protein
VIIKQQNKQIASAQTAPADNNNSSVTVHILQRTQGDNRMIFSTNALSLLAAVALFGGTTFGMAVDVEGVVDDSKVSPVEQCQRIPCW